MANTIFAVLLVSLVLVRFLTEDYLKKSKVTFVLLAALTVMCVFQGLHNLANWRILVSWELVAVACIVICFNVWLGIKEYMNIEDEYDEEESDEKEPVKVENAEAVDFEDLEYVDE